MLLFTLLQKLFTSDGIGLSLLRQPIACSDLSPDPPGLYNYQPTPTSEFSVTADGPILGLLRAAIELNQEIKIVATPWSGTPSASVRLLIVLLEPSSRVDEERFLNVWRLATR